MEKLNVAIADDNVRIVEMLDNMLSKDAAIEVVGKAHNGEDVLDIIKKKENQYLDVGFIIQAGL